MPLRQSASIPSNLVAMLDHVVKRLDQIEALLHSIDQRLKEKGDAQ